MIFKIFMPGDHLPIERDLDVNDMLKLAPGDDVSIDGDVFMVQSIKMKMKSTTPGGDGGEVRVIRRPKPTAN